MASQSSMTLDLSTGEVSVHGTRIDVTSMVRAAAKKPVSQRRARDNYVRTSVPAFERRLTRHYQNLLRQIREVLEHGVPHPSGTVSFSGVDGQAVSFVTGWDELTEKYRRRKKPSFRDKFWRANIGTSKAKGSAGGPSVPLLESYRASINPRNFRVHAEKSAVKRGSYQEVPGGASITVTTQFRVDALPEPLDRLVRKPFMSGGRDGAPAIPRSLSGNRFDLSKIILVERRRPMVSGMSALLGRLMYDELSLR